MTTTRILQAAMAATLMLLGCSPSSDNSSTGSSASSPTAKPDNTAVNERDRANATLTPADQGGSEADREMTRRIREAITANDQLSADAKNVKIITLNGKVTLRGPVKNEEERKTIQSIVEKMGATPLDNQLEAKATNQ